MITRRRNSLAKVLFAAFMLWLQAATLAHASAYDGPDHSHNDVVCDLELIAEDDALLIPAIPELIAPNFETVREIPAFAPIGLWLRPPGRAPPPRGPPLTKQ